MADSAKNNEELSLPRATVNKFIKELLPDNVKCANETLDLIIECCVEFVHLIASESNEVCTKGTKKTISPEHVITALRELGLDAYVGEVEGAFEKHKTDQQTKPRKKSKKLENLGISQEELLRAQQELFARAKAGLSASPSSENLYCTTIQPPPTS
eukprot:gnl/Hemi2/22479_TR7490_c0_g1_i1.p1 gnl/Hemi2/22479_TR7490_c0_g1~~gnl/Hemi2/22479_TR7490_c0_g1_i1.p1  ORF type:complete len:172 (-),score=78.83 gnl/Hemi2/22479_TR7490_c0_g1_i1:272-739(-)